MKASAQGTNSTGLGLEAIAQAFEEIARTDISRSKLEDPEPGEMPPAKPPSAPPVGVPPQRRFTIGKVALSGLIGCLAMACAGAIVFVWPTSGSRTAKSDPVPPVAAPASISVASGERQPATTQAIPSSATARIAKGIEQPAVQPEARLSESAVSVPPETAQRIQALERRLTNLEQGIEQIKSDQTRLARENSDLLGGLRQAQEKLALRVQEFASDAKAAEERAARDRLMAAEQLKGSQEQLLRFDEQLKARQDQVDQMKAAAQRRAAKPPPSPQQPPIAALPAKPVPKPPSPQVAVSPPQNTRQPLAR